MIYLSDETGRITGTITAHMVGYEETLDAAGQAYVKTEERVDIDTHWIETLPDGARRLAARLPALVSVDPDPVTVGGSWTGPVMPAGAVIAIDGEAHFDLGGEALILAPEVPGVYAIRIEHPRFLPSAFDLTVTP